MSQVLLFRLSASLPPRRLVLVTPAMAAADPPKKKSAAKSPQWRRALHTLHPQWRRKAHPQWRTRAPAHPQWRMSSPQSRKRKRKRSNPPQQASQQSPSQQSSQKKKKEGRTEKKPLSAEAPAASSDLSAIPHGVNPCVQSKAAVAAKARPLVEAVSAPPGATPLIPGRYAVKSGGPPPPPSAHDRSSGSNKDDDPSRSRRSKDDDRSSGKRQYDDGSSSVSRPDYGGTDSQSAQSDSRSRSPSRERSPSSSRARHRSHSRSRYVSDSRSRSPSPLRRASRREKRVHLKPRTRSPAVADRPISAGWHARWHNFQGGYYRRPTFKISNMIFGTFYISAVADSDAVLRQIGQSPLHVTVLHLEEEECPVADAFMHWSHGSLPGDLRGHMANKTIMFLNKRLFIAMHIGIVTDFMVSHVNSDEEVSFAVVRFNVRPCMTAVAVDIVDSYHSCIRLPSWIMQAMHDTVVLYGTRMITGVFGHTGQQMAELCQNLPLATAQPLFQGWRGPSSAVAGSSSASSSAFVENISVAETIMCFPS